MKLTATIITLATTLTIMGTALASMPGNTVEYGRPAIGEIVFDGTSHAEAGLGCADCHPNLFTMEVEAEMTMADHNAGTYCFSCHQEGGSAFPANDCAKCHKK